MKGGPRETFEWEEGRGGEEIERTSSGQEGESGEPKKQEKKKRFTKGGKERKSKLDREGEWGVVSGVGEGQSVKLTRKRLEPKKDISGFGKLLRGLSRCKRGGVKKKPRKAEQWGDHQKV